MSRSQGFDGKRLPLKGLRNFKPSHNSTAGPFGFLNPTRHHLSHSPSPAANASDPNDDDDDEGPMVPADSVNFRWTSRNNRKGRHELEYSPAKDPSTAKYLAPESTSSPREIIKIIIRMIIYYPIYDISWLVAYVFTWGSIIWVINAL
jgi:hypothetical protein